MIDDDYADMELTFYSVVAAFPEYEVKYFLQPEDVDTDNLDDVALIILDIMFQGQSLMKKGGANRGLEFYEEIKGKNNSIPIILYTNRDKTKTIQDFLENKLNDNDIFQQKFADFELLIDLINRTIPK